MTSENLTYIDALLATKYLYRNNIVADTDPKGLISLDTTQYADSIIVKQNNTIIHLLVSISDKLDRLLKQPPTSQGLDDITKKLSSIDLGTRKARKQSEPWQFFQVAPVP